MATREEMQRAILAARALSYTNQGKETIIPADKLKEKFTFFLGFQPSGISSENIGLLDNRVLITNYYAPAVCISNVFEDEQGLRFQHSWVRGVNHGVCSVRLFPDTPPGDNNRAICAFFDVNGNLLALRNADRIFYLHTPPKENGGRWTLSNKINVPERSNEVMWVESVACDPISGTLYTIESNEVNYSRLRSYAGNNVLKPTQLDFSLPVSMYGIGIHAGKLWFVTDFRSEAKHGIYSWQEGDVELKLVIPEVCGSGIAFLKNGSALVPEYGESRPGPLGGGEPGSLTYFPVSMFK